MWSPLSAECEGLGIILSLRESSLGDSLGGAQKGERACGRISEVWVPLPVPPVAPHWLTCQILGNQLGAKMSTECKQTLKSMWKINFPWTNKALKPAVLGTTENRWVLGAIVRSLTKMRMHFLILQTLLQRNSTVYLSESCGVVAEWRNRFEGARSRRRTMKKEQTTANAC